MKNEKGQKKKMEKGITLIALVITIVILLILAGISIGGTIIGQDETEESVEISELNIVQHAILERYTAARLTKQELPGVKIAIENVNEIIEEINAKTGEHITLKGTEYYKLEKADLEKLGITQEENTFIVNYSTGEVIDETLKVTKSGEALYIYSKTESE